MAVEFQSTSLSLLERAKRRDEQAWSRLTYVYAPLLDYWCRGWGVQGSDAEDLRQEVFQAVLHGLETFRRDQPGHSFRGWLRVIAHRKFLDQWRKRQRQPDARGGSDAHHRMLQLPEPPPDTDDGDPPEQVSQLHHRGLEVVRGEFEPKTWQAFWQTAVDGQSPLDVGQKLGMTTAAVRKAKSRVLLRLREELGDVLDS